jgi:hypothetical protein
MPVKLATPPRIATTTGQMTAETIAAECRWRVCRQARPWRPTLARGRVAPISFDASGVYQLVARGARLPTGPVYPYDIRAGLGAKTWAGRLTRKDPRWPRPAAGRLLSS